MKKFLTILSVLIFSTNVCANDKITGYWTTVDDETGDKKSVVQIYEHNGQYFGRVVDLFKNKEAVAKLPQNPKILGLDIIWNLSKDGNKYTGGNILDPQKGKVYGCEIWREDNNLIVRGKIAFLGRNQTWLKNTDFKSEDSNLIPNIPVK